MLLCPRQPYCFTSSPPVCWSSRFASPRRLVLEEDHSSLSPKQSVRAQNSFASARPHPSARWGSSRPALVAADLVVWFRALLALSLLVKEGRRIVAVSACCGAHRETPGSSLAFSFLKKLWLCPKSTDLIPQICRGDGTSKTVTGLGLEMQSWLREAPFQGPSHQECHSSARKAGAGACTAGKTRSQHIIKAFTVMSRSGLNYS